MSIWIRAVNGCLIGKFYPLWYWPWRLYFHSYLVLFLMPLRITPVPTLKIVNRYWPISCQILIFDIYYSLSINIVKLMQASKMKSHLTGRKQMWHYNVFSLYCFHIIIFVINTGTCTQQIKSMCSEHRALESNRGFNRAKKKLTFLAKLNDSEQLTNLIFNITNMTSDWFYFV